MPEIFQPFSLPRSGGASKAAAHAKEKRSRSPMDRTMVSEAVGGGSIPPGTTFVSRLL